MNIQNFVIYAVITALLGFLTICTSEYQSSIEKYLKKRKMNALKYIKYIYFSLGLLWLSNFSWAIWGWVNSEGTARVMYLVTAVIALYILNLHRTTLQTLVVKLLIPLATLGWKAISLKSPKPLNIKFRNLSLFFLCALSFSLDDFEAQINFKIIGIIIPLVAYTYALLMIIDTILLQKLLIETSSNADKIYDFLSKMDIDDFLKGKAGAIVGAVISFFKTVNPKKFSNLVDKLKDKIEKLAFWSLYGVAILRTYMMTRILSSFIFLSVFVTIVEGNYLFTIQKISGQSTNLFSAIAASFFLYTGNPPDLPEPLSSPFYSLQTLSLAYLGWILFVVLLILAIDIFSSSFEHLSQSATKVLKVLEEDLRKILVALEKHPKLENPEQIIDAISTIFAASEMTPDKRTQFEESIASLKKDLERVRKEETQNIDDQTITVTPITS